MVDRGLEQNDLDGAAVSEGCCNLELSECKSGERADDCDRCSVLVSKLSRVWCFSSLRCWRKTAVFVVSVELTLDDSVNDSGVLRWMGSHLGGPLGGERERAGRLYSRCSQLSRNDLRRGITRGQSQRSIQVSVHDHEFTSIRVNHT